MKLARNLVTNAEWLAFMQDGGYEKATLWLMDGFAAAGREGWEAPGHWRKIDGEWKIRSKAIMGWTGEVLSGFQHVDSGTAK